MCRNIKASMRLLPLAVVLGLAACSPAQPTDPRAAAGTWPPKDYAEFEARPPMSVAAELDDEWNMAIEAERWVYQIGVALVGVGANPPAQRGAPAAGAEDHLARTARGVRNAAARLAALQKLTCATPPIAKPEDCAAFAPPPWFAAAATDPTVPPHDEIFDHLQWFQENAPKFVQPACEAAMKRTGDQRYCAVE